jgi:D-3-phosphoglycerate dehydrogenase
MIMLVRDTLRKNKTHKGIWDKFNSVELRGKKLGIVGYGSIGLNFNHK